VLDKPHTWFGSNAASGLYLYARDLFKSLLTTHYAPVCSRFVLCIWLVVYLIILFFAFGTAFLYQDRRLLSNAVITNLNAESDRRPSKFSALVLILLPRSSSWFKIGMTVEHPKLIYASLSFYTCFLPV